MNREAPLKTINHLAQGGGQFAPPLFGRLQAGRTSNFVFAVPAALARHNPSAFKSCLITKLVWKVATIKEYLIVGRSTEMSGWKKGGKDASS